MWTPQALFELRRIDECIEAAESPAGPVDRTLFLCRQIGRAVPVGMWLARRALRRQRRRHVDLGLARDWMVDHQPAGVQVELHIDAAIERCFDRDFVRAVRAEWL